MQGAYLRVFNVALNIKGVLFEVIPAPAGEPLGSELLDRFGADVLNYGASDIYDVERNGKHTLIPAIDDVVVEIDTENQTVRIKPMKGLFDEN